MSETPSPKAAGRKPKSRLMLSLAIGLAGATILGGGGWFLLPRLLGKAHAPAPAVEKPVVVKATVPLGPVIVNLAGHDRRYVKVALDVGVPGENDVKEIEEHRAQLLDLVIGMLSTRGLEELTSPETRAALKQELLVRMREDLHLEKVGGLYFTEFVIQ